MDDSKLIWEAYIGEDIQKPELIEESVWSTIVEIYKDLRNAMKRGLQKEDIVYYLSLIKSRNENYYRTILKNIRTYVRTEIGAEQYDKITMTILMILMSIVSFGTSVGAVAALDKTGLPNKAIDYAFENKAKVIQFLDDIERAVDTVGSKVYKK